MQLVAAAVAAAAAVYTRRTTAAAAAATAVVAAASRVPTRPTKAISHSTSTTIGSARSFVKLMIAANKTNKICSAVDERKQNKMKGEKAHADRRGQTRRRKVQQACNEAAHARTHRSGAGRRDRAVRVAAEVEDWAVGVGAVDEARGGEAPPQKR